MPLATELTLEPGICRGCQKAILWIVNENGKKEPFDAKAVRVLLHDGEDQLHAPSANHRIVQGHYGHFVTCPQAARFHKGKKEEPKNG